MFYRPKCSKELLARFGLTRITLYDFDAVEPKNIANQMFRQEHTGMMKTLALSDIIHEINPDVKGHLRTEEKGFTGQKLSGYVFLCVDNIELRREIAISNRENPYIRAMFDFRTRLTDAQHYSADWSDMESVDSFIRSMDFSHEEAMAETPVSACNIALSAAPAVRIVCALGTANFVNFVKGGELRKFIQIDAFKFILDAF
ncbi:MAG: ThiF family adenylyltransferase [Oscillospiraceae bacterium]|nr:ThiF family adenylyltransferase [Oscillospiraceae bacterium]